MGTLVAAIICVVVTTALLAWGAWHVCQDAERMQRDPKLLRRRFLLFGTLYIASSIYGIVQVASGEAPLGSLIGLPIAGGMAWLFIKEASKVKVDPS